MSAIFNSVSMKNGKTYGECVKDLFWELLQDEHAAKWAKIEGNLNEFAEMVKAEMSELANGGNASVSEADASEAVASENGKNIITLSLTDNQRLKLEVILLMAEGVLEKDSIAWGELAKELKDNGELKFVNAESNRDWYWEAAEVAKEVRLMIERQ